MAQSENSQIREQEVREKISMTERNATSGKAIEVPRDALYTGLNAPLCAK